MISPARRRTSAAIVFLASCVLLAAACGSSSNKAAKKSTTTSTSATPTTTVTGVVVEPTGLKIIQGSATGESPCEKAAPVPSSPGQVGGGQAGSDAKASPAEVAASEHGERGMVVQEPLTKTEREALEQQMSAARLVAAEFPTVKAAEQAGYHMSTTFVPCIGAHYTKINYISSFDAAHPSELLFDGTSPDSKIVGLSYLVYHSDGPPPGFAGDNDHWHQHNANGGLCLKGATVIGAEETTNEECAARGGKKGLLINIWMVHAWIVPGFECSWGTFSGECPELGGRLCGTAWDAPDPNDQTACKKLTK